MNKLIPEGKAAQLSVNHTMREVCECVSKAIMASFNDGMDAYNGGIFLLPRKFTFDNYITAFQNRYLLTSFLVSIGRTVIGTVVSVIFICLLGYALADERLPGRKFITKFFFFTTLFGGGAIPMLLLISDLNLLDNFLVYIVPGGVHGCAPRLGGYIPCGSGNRIAGIPARGRLRFTWACRTAAADAAAHERKKQNHEQQSQSIDFHRILLVFILHCCKRKALSERLLFWPDSPKPSAP